jgi:hypothetical protein
MSLSPHQRCYSSGLSLFYEYYTPQKGFSARTRSSIPSKTIICRNRPFCWNLSIKHWDQRCSACFRTHNRNQKPLLRCSRCKVVHYCSQECQKVEHFIHKAVCGEMIARIFHDGHHHEVNDIIILLKTLSIIDRSGARRECGLESHEIISCGSTHVELMSQDINPASIDTATDNLIQYVSDLSGKPYQVVLKYRKIMQANNFGIFDEMMNCIGEGVYPQAAILNHSCNPNCIVRYKYGSHGPILELITIRDVSLGEELSHSYVDCALPKHRRIEHLNRIYGFRCDCFSCGTIMRSLALEVQALVISQVERTMSKPLALKDLLSTLLLRHGEATILHILDHTKERLITVSD